MTNIENRPIFKEFNHGSGQVRSGRVDGNSDNRANSAQLQLKLPTGAELGKKAIKYVMLA